MLCACPSGTWTLPSAVQKPRGWLQGIGGSFPIWPKSVDKRPVTRFLSTGLSPHNDWCVAPPQPFEYLQAPSLRAAQDKPLFQTTPLNGRRNARGRKRAGAVCSSMSLYSNSSSSRQRPNLWTRLLGCFRSTTYRHHSPVRGALLLCPRKRNNFSEAPSSVDNCQDMRVCHTGLSTGWRDGSVKNAVCSAVGRSSRRDWAS